MWGQGSHLRIDKRTKIRIPRISGNFGACADSVYQALFPLPPKVSLGLRLGPARYKLELIYVQTKMSDQDSVELALIMKKKERKKERRKIDKWPIF